MNSSSIPTWNWVACRGDHSNGILNYEECLLLNEAIDSGVHRIYFELNGELVVIYPIDSAATHLRAAPIADPDAPRYILSKDLSADGWQKTLDTDAAAAAEIEDNSYGDGSSLEPSLHAPCSPDTRHSGISDPSHVALFGHT